MIILKESAVPYANWMNLVKGKVFNEILFHDSKDNLRFNDYGKFSIEFNYIEKDSITIHSTSGLNSRGKYGFSINNVSRTVAKIEYNGATNGYVIILQNGGRVSVF
jgi:hypothetical protein